MKITVLTLFPKMIAGFLEESIIKRAQEKGSVTIEIINIRDFAADSYGTVDDKPYGGGVGMVMKADVIGQAINHSKVEGLLSKVVYVSPKGKIFTQEKAKEFSKLDHLIILAAHYEGIDERVMSMIDEEVSMGDFVMTGGEIPAAAIIDSVVRLIPGVLKREEATSIESFYEVAIDELIGVVGEDEILKALKAKKDTVKLLEYPQYTRPEIFNGQKVPDMLMSGNHKEIEKWKMQKAYEETKKKRPDLLAI